MFIGEYRHSIDEKGRVSIPSKFRGELASGCVVTRGLDKCLWVYPLGEWQNLAEKIAELPITQKNARSFSRLMLAGASDVDLDRVGRINLPGYLREYADISKDVVFVGIYNRIEIWPADVWANFKKEMEDNSSEVAESLSEIGF
ncbi:cell division/cell wall cluster transcriptional repressor MraZ [Candidatus Berkelbacteria bacterium CG1_02_42_45]|uniref:Transcriptional regulator MraZ n=5 Tax=Candidatus Berkelbacteria TaxID=1618330 RepID=A0A2M7K122_9BACT|nr:MAG: cell division/cell wall cluster transcriptional repressor MraZ [Candidatus Berkelbacteria bacterium CG1_02_42_45]PIP51104.1 MAG: cell division/cell wall cluster transcriptional repressor MraZ [Candidatus Berkelbacteria bacterium CG23_combo_of_CG06-09_8_20_14_all_41_73]PIR27213.1 MAG: cell division/cell wall cluster transcriptional repressor MraZ [Candidatus Berkelbacteria bacterium CG11_big_fil_rev_8_21_14_0_20_42_15]PIX29957.1 MAG: cell division/cell wall cluster transcriptional repress